MIQIDNADIIEQHHTLVQTLKDGVGAPLLGIDFLKEAFPKLEAEANAIKLAELRKKDSSIQSIYPYEVKIPKSMDEMLKGDFEPARVLTIKEPFAGPGCNVWFGSTLDGVNLRWGYTNGDSRKIAKNALDDFTVHGFLAGATGQGKSVTVNALIYAMCAEYPPWELTLTLSDAKIVEFKTIALAHAMPQIDIVAATSDTDYLISMLEVKNKEMEDRNKLFPEAGKAFGQEVKNIKQFRKVTGLCLPRCVMLFDECTAMFQKAGKKAGRIAELIDGFARLGRSSGMHVFLDSQEVSSDIPDKTLANLQLRSAMGCTSEISEKVIGNDAAAANMGKKGRLLVNTDPASKNNKSKNVLVRVPFFTDEQLSEVSDVVIEDGKKCGFGGSLRFFDESEGLYSEKYKAFLNQYAPEKNEILLGPPSFIMKGEKEAVRMEFTGDNAENICIFSNSISSKIRAVSMLKQNFMRMPGQTHCMLVIDPAFAREIDLKELKPVMCIEEKSYESSQFFDTARSLVYRRLLAFKADTLAFAKAETDPAVDDIFYQNFDKGSEYDSVINRVRFKYYFLYLNTDAEFCSAFRFTGSKSEAEDTRKIKIAVNCIKMCHDNNCADTPLTRAKVANAWFWVFGIERLLGIGRDSKTKFVEDLKKVMFDCYSANARFILTTSSFENISGLLETFGYFLIEDLTEQQISKIKAGDFVMPITNNKMMVLYSPYAELIADKSQKFKKLMFDDEI